MDQKSLLSVVGLPAEFGVALLLLSLVLLLAPYFAGHDFGVVKIPAFAAAAQRKLKVLGPVAMLIALILHIPMIDAGKTTSGGSNPPAPTPGASTMQLDVDSAKGTAKVGSATISSYNRAVILIVARDIRDGSGIATLTSRGHIGDEKSVIPFPSGWRLDTKLVPPGGCTLQPTHIYNDGTGGYTLSVMTVARKEPCPWLTGEYRFLLQIHVAENQASGIGKVVID